MKNEMIKFVEVNFNIIKDNFYNSELDILSEIEYEDNCEMEYCRKCLDDQMDIFTVGELINIINERSLGVDLDSSELEDLFNEIKFIQSGTR